MNTILFCEKCREYTLHESCHRCGEKAVSRKPAKFTFPDKYVSQRIEKKKFELSEKGFL